MPDLRIKPNIDNGDLPKQMELDFNKKELEPISFCDQTINYNDFKRVTIDQYFKDSFNAIFGSRSEK